MEIVIISLMPIVVFFAYRQGLKDGLSVTKFESIPKIVPFNIERKKKEEQTKTEIVNRNIENYNGSSQGQIKL